MAELEARGLVPVDVRRGLAGVGNRVGMMFARLPIADLPQRPGRVAAHGGILVPCERRLQCGAPQRVAQAADHGPGLQRGHQVRVYFNGQPRMVNSTSFTIDEVWRGVHNIQAEVLDETGKMLIRTRPNRFYVQQTTVR